MRKNSVTGRALRLYHSYNPKYFPVKFLELLFTGFAPYFTLWMSAEIITALYEGRSSESIYLLVVLTLAGNLLVRILSAVLRHESEHHKRVLDNAEAAAFNAKTISLDYDKLENPDIRQHRRNITENAYINSHGVELLRRCIESVMEHSVDIVFALILFAEMVVQLATAKLSAVGVSLFVTLIASMVCSGLLGAKNSKKAAEEYQKGSDVLLELNRLGRGYSMNQLDSRVYRQYPLINQFWMDYYKRYVEIFGVIKNKMLKLEIPTVITRQITQLCSYLIVCLYCAMGVFPMGSVIKYVGYLGKLCTDIEWLFSSANEMRNNEPFLKLYLDYFDIQNDMYQGSLSVEKRSDKKFDIEFKNVNFRYPGASEDALKDINLSLKVGERLAVVGMNGSGKTTFIKLLCRLYDPRDGEIIMNDFNIRKYDYRQYLDLFSVVFQDYKLLAMPLGNNVASSDHWDAAKAQRLLEEVGFGERYAEMPKKLETPLYKDFDEDGVNVSGGEAQKIALARALYKDAPFIILDEPTAALDPIAEAEIYSRFDNIVGDKTAIYISHRLSSCRFCDKIAVFHEGRIVQVGTHDELLADETGKYYELWHAQAQYYTEEKAG